MALKIPALIVMLALIASAVTAQEAPLKTIRLDYLQEDNSRGGFLPRRELARPRVGLALSGGGARGFAHIGVLKAFEAAGIPVDIVAGTSMGCVVGGLYAAGQSPEDLERISKEIDWFQIFTEGPHRESLFLTQKQDEYKSLLKLRFGGWGLSFPTGLTSAQKLSDLLADLTMTTNYRAQGDFDNLNIPFRAVVTDIVSGQSIVIGEGDLGEALRAGLAVPLVFTPVERNGMLLADGGLLDVIPVDVAREMGTDVVVAVDVTSPLSSREQLEKPWVLVDQIIAIMMREPKLASLASADVIIVPDLKGHLPSDFRNIDELIRAGEQAAFAAVEEIRGRIRAHEGNSIDTTAFLLGSVELQTDNGASSLAMPAVPFLPGDQISEVNIRDFLRTLSEKGIYQDAYATVEMAEEGARLIFHFMEMPLFNGYRIFGNTLFTEQELLEDTVLKPGQVLNPRIADGDLKTILKRYHSKGYALARFTEVKMNPQDGTIRGEIEEGIIQRVLYKGNDKTKRWVLSRELTLNKGDIFNLQQARRGIDNIYGTGLFERVTMEIQRGKQGAILVVRVKEKASLSLAVGARYDLEREAEGFVHLAEENFLGVGSMPSLFLQFGRFREEAQAGLKADRIFKTYLTFDVNGYVRRRDWKSYVNGRTVGEYELDRRGGRFFLGQHIRRFGMVSVEGRVERVKITSNYGHGHPTGEREIRSLILRSKMDTMDRFPFPTSGHAYSAYLEIGQPLLGGTEEFRKAFASLESYVTFWSRQTFFAKGSLGVSESPLPFSERFRLGGEETLYGFRQGELLGNKLFLLNLGYRMELVRKFYFGTRYDVGNVWEHELQIKWRTTKHAIGVGLALDSPLGPVTLTYGRANEGQERAYFSAGFRF
jgi:NTE family protein